MCRFSLLGRQAPSSLSPARPGRPGRSGPARPGLIRPGLAQAGPGRATPRFLQKVLFFCFFCFFVSTSRIRLLAAQSQKSRFYCSKTNIFPVIMCRFSLLGRQVLSLSRPGPARPGPARPGPARPDPAWPGSGRAGPGWVEPSQKSMFYYSKTMIFDVIMCRFSLPRGQSPPPSFPGSAGSGLARSDQARLGPACSGSAWPGPG